jgi:hypothetical protein
MSFGKLNGLNYAPYESLKYEYKPTLNAGLFTGEPFYTDAPWRNFPSKPETSSLVNKNLLSANPPPGAQYHYPSANHRPGNNTPEVFGIENCKGFYLIKDETLQPKHDCYQRCSHFPKNPQC